MKSRMLGALIARAERRDERLQIRLHIVEVDRPRLRAPLLLESRPVCGRADAHRLAEAAHRERSVGRLRIANEHASNLEYADPFELARLVVLQVRHQRADERRAHHRLMARNRVEQAHRVRLSRKIELPLRLDEGEVDHLVVIGRGEALAQLMQAALLGHAGKRRGRARRVRRDALVAIEPRHFLDQVFLDREVVAIGRRLHDKRIGLALVRQREPLEALLHFRGRDGHADDLLRARNAHAHRLALRQARDEIVGRPWLAAADVENQPRGALDALHVVREIHAALEAVSCIAREPVAARAAHDRVGPEERRLEKYLPRAGVRLGRLAAHDATEADDTAVVRNA